MDGTRVKTIIIVFSSTQHQKPFIIESSRKLLNIGSNLFYGIIAIGNVNLEKASNCDDLFIDTFTI